MAQEPEYDVIIAGGGMAGLLTAAAVGFYSKQNARVLVVDRNSATQPGRKTAAGWTCGDATSRASLDYLAKNIGIRYGFPEIEHPVDGVLLFSPDRQTKILFEGEGVLLNRKLLARRQVEDARKLGVEFASSVELDALYAEEGWIRGVRGRNRDGSVFKKTARVVVDSSGSATKLRRSIPIDCKIEKDLDGDDLEIAGRCIYEFESGVDDRSWFDPKHAIIHFDQDLAPGGYCWTFPKGENKVNIGLGLQKSGLDARNRRFGRKETFRVLLDKYVRSNKAIRNPVLSSGDPDHGNARGTWQVPVRRQNDCLVANGYALIGDAAWMPRPVDGGGIGPAIYASVILGRVIVGSLEARDTSEAGLWGYNIEYMRSYGCPMASFEVLRAHLQTLTNEQISYGMRHFLSEGDVARVTRREHPEFDRTRRLNPLLWLRILAEPDLARGLRYTAKKSQALISHNLSFPETPGGWQDWKRGLDGELGEPFKRFKVKGVGAPTPQFQAR